MPKAILFSVVLFIAWFPQLKGQTYNSRDSLKKEVYALVDTVLKLTDKRKFKEAFEFAEISKQYAEKHLGQQSMAYARLVNAQGRNFVFQGKYEEGKSYFYQALEIYEAIDPNDKFVALITTNIGLCYRNLNLFDQAEPFYQRSCKIRLDSFGRNSTYYADGLNSLGLLAWNQSNLNTAERLLLQTIEIQKSINATQNAKFANTLNNLALVYKDMGEYAKAEPLYLSASALRKELLGEYSVEYGTSMNNLALFYADLNNYTKALETAQISLEIRRKVLGTHHPDFGQSLLSVGFLLFERKNFEAAIDTLYSAKQLYESLNLVKTESYFLVLTNLGLAHSHLKNKTEALQYLRSAQSAAQEIFGEISEQNAQAFMNLGYLFLNNSDNETAMSELAKSIDLFTQTNPDNQHYTTAIFDYVETTRRAQGRLDTALAFQFLKIMKEKHQMLATFLNETELSIAIKKVLPMNDLLCSHLWMQPEHQDEMAKQVFDYHLFHKQFTLASSFAVNMLAKVKRDTVTFDVYDRWKGYKKKLMIEYSQNLRDATRIALLSHVTDSLEKILVRAVHDFGEYRKTVGWEDVQKALLPGEAAVEFIRFTMYHTMLTDSVMYAALVIRPGAKAPLFVPLFNKNEIVPVVQASFGSNFLKVNALYNFKEGNNTLYELIWKPLEMHLSGVHSIYCAPEGLLHRLNLSAISVNAKAHYSDRRKITVMGSVRQLITSRHDEAFHSSAYLAGGIHYAMDSAAINYHHPNKTRSITSASLEFEADSSMWGESWTYLPESGREVHEITSLLIKNGYTTQLDTGYQATEESFFDIGIKQPSPRIIHLSTHGYFFADPILSQSTRNRIEFQPAFKTSEHPLIRSGLILAGGNRAWSGQPAPEGMEDGILTAYEISQMNLTNTELVVLSACETGLGDIQDNEGVYGLQRAFKIAGAKYLIMSLWKVNDQTTRELMTEFYRQWLNEKHTIPEAFAAAQAHQRAKYPGAPYHWAGFVLVE